MTTPRPLPADDTLLDLHALRAQPPLGDERIEIGRRLVRRALDKRDADAARLVAGWMDIDPIVDEELYARLARAINVQPDAVYTFIRAVIGMHHEADEQGARTAVWRARLKVAALVSLQVAITDGDSDTILSWLKLIAREPAAYALGDVLNSGIAAAHQRASVDPSLARALVLLAAKRAPLLLDDLLGDDTLRAQLPDALCEALHYGIGDSAALYEGFGAEVFLSALYRASGLHQPDLFTGRAIEQVWTLAVGDNGGAAAAEKLLKLWGSGESLVWMPPDALAALLMFALLDRRDDLFYALTGRIASHPAFPTLLARAIVGGKRSTSGGLAIVAQLTASGQIDQQGAADSYSALLDAVDWHEDSFEWVEGLARLLQQHSEVTASANALWHMIALAGELREDFAARTALRRLTALLETTEDENDFAEEVTRLSALVHWTGAARAGLLTWWRDYTHSAQSARLQRLERVLPEKTADGRRADDLRAILSTVLSFRRMIGKRSFGGFAEDVSTTFAVLQALAEAFDPNAKRALIFDAATFRAEIEARLEEVPLHERKILANNLKELAHLVTVMADHRSKATIVRRAEDIDRMLTTGDQEPHGAVDALKWLAGYLAGSQHDDDDE
ncbi:MAG: hypothetical protein SGJ24_15955 [Chloroflexota bacterium]|nr:hypothetical protein [Chloroflexota bacterium]